MHEGYRKPGDNTCALCENKVPTRENVLCESCLKLHSPAHIHAGSGLDVVYYGPIGSIMEMRPIHCSDDQFIQKQH